MKSLAEWVGELDRLLISTWRDGESLSALAEAYQVPGKLRAPHWRPMTKRCGTGKSRASVQTIESRANLQDRYAAKLFKKDPDAATTTVGGCGTPADGTERRSRRQFRAAVAAGRQLQEKRDGGRAAERTKYFKAAADFYQNAYKHTKATESRIDLYSGLNAVALSYVAGVPNRTSRRNASNSRPRQKDYPDFWARVYRPDALLLGHLRAGDLDGHVDEVIKAYKDAFQHGTPHERDSALGQLRFLIAAGPAKR